MRVMNHPNVCGLKAYFYSQGDGKVGIYPDDDCSGERGLDDK
jgi:hypothetical protein